MFLMVMEMRMSDWTDFVGVISVCFKVQVPSVLFCLILYEFYIKCLGVLWLHLTVPWVSLQCVIVVFPYHTHLLFFRGES